MNQTTCKWGQKCPLYTTPKSLPSLVKKLLQHSHREITALLLRNCSTTAKILQHSCQEIEALLSRDHSTPVKKLQNSCQQNDRILKSLPPMHFTCINFYLYVRVKRYINLFKMAEDNVNLTELVLNLAFLSIFQD